MNQEAALKKDIGLSVAMSIVIGTVIGSGIFMKPGSVLEYTGNSNLALLAWALGGLITLAGGLTIAEGRHRYLRRADFMYIWKKYMGSYGAILAAGCRRLSMGRLSLVHWDYTLGH